MSEARSSLWQCLLDVEDLDFWGTTTKRSGVVSNADNAMGTQPATRQLGGSLREELQGGAQ